MSLLELINGALFLVYRDPSRMFGCRKDGGTYGRRSLGMLWCKL